MVHRRVTHTRKDEHGDITALCGGSPWFKVSKRQAIREIKARTHAYYVGEPPYRVYVEVFPGENGNHLRTEADQWPENNLDNLPDC